MSNEGYVVTENGGFDGFLWRWVMLKVDSQFVDRGGGAGVCRSFLVCSLKGVPRGS